MVRWRGEIVPPGPGQAAGLLDLGGFYGLHPTLTGMHDRYAAGDLLPIHAVAGHYRSRSHFAAQDFMESGADQRMNSGWLHRTLAAMPATRSLKEPAAAVSVTVPLLLRGPRGCGHLGASKPLDTRMLRCITEPTRMARGHHDRYR